MRKWFVKFRSVQDGFDYDLDMTVSAKSAREAMDSVGEYCASLWSTCDVYYIEEIK